MNAPAPGFLQPVFNVPARKFILQVQEVFRHLSKYLTVEHPF